MTQGNKSSVRQFVLMGITNDPHLQHILFTLFLLIYLTSVIGNTSIMIIILVFNNLHSPMYYFLSNLSFSDLCYSTVISPKMLFDFFLERKLISFIGCALQLYFFGVFASTECYLLSTMAYDRYVAICHPLRYVLIMDRRKCVILTLIIYIGGLCTAGVYASCTFTLPYCGPNVINHFYCDIPPLMALSCADTYMSKTIIFGIVFCLGLFLLSVILASYAYIFLTIMTINSSEGRHKAFSTCSSHLMCVALLYGTVFFMYLRPASNYSVTQDKIVSVFYTMIIPMMNPIIYCLRNKEVKVAVKYSISRLLVRTS